MLVIEQCVEGSVLCEKVSNIQDVCVGYSILWKEVIVHTFYRVDLQPSLSVELQPLHTMSKAQESAHYWLTYSYKLQVILQFSIW